jgi:hypothetical protein
MRKAKRSKAKAARAGRKSGQVFKPYPTFFTNATEEWMKNIEKLLEE